ncbi:hypothetical protein [Mycetohabitans sp. B46]
MATLLWGAAVVALVALAVTLLAAGGEQRHRAYWPHGHARRRAAPGRAD